MAAPSCPPVLIIAGPTASGKSALALEHAAERGGVIINADATQLYADLRIISARPSPNDEAAAPHRLFGVRDATAPASAAQWAALAEAQIAAAHRAGRLPILVGGTGLYLRTLIEGIAPVPAIDPAIRDAVRALDPAAARAALEREDPAAAAVLVPADRQRTMRALEVVRGTGRPLAHWQQRREGGIAATMAVRGIVIDLPPDALAARIERRFDAMLAAGALDEARTLAARALSPGLPLMKACGLRPLIRLAQGECTLAQARTAAIIETRQYAKRQRTWFRHQMPAWERLDPAAAAALQRA